MKRSKWLWFIIGVIIILGLLDSRNVKTTKIGTSYAESSVEAANTNEDSTEEYTMEQVQEAIEDMDDTVEATSHMILILVSLFSISGVVISSVSLIKLRG